MHSLEFMLLSAVLVGVGVTVASIWTAPEGAEDEHGFQEIWVNNRPEAQDVCCIWKVAEHA
jgi:hypothetical protein